MKKFLTILITFTLLISSMTISAFAATENVEAVTTAHSIPLFACDAPLGAFAVDQKDFKAGNSSLTYTLGTYTDGEGTQVTHLGQSGFSFRFEDVLGKASVDASKMDTLEFWFYVSDKDALSQVAFADNAFELTSSGTHDKEETNWRLPDILAQCKQNGWNEIRLSLNNNGQADLTRLNYLRWYFVNAVAAPATPIVIKIDAIRLTDYEAQMTEKLTPVAQEFAAELEEKLKDIPEWDETNADIVAQYKKNAESWRTLFTTLDEKYDAQESIVKNMLSDMGAKIQLNRVGRWLERYDEYLGESGGDDGNDSKVEPIEVSDKTMLTVLSISAALIFIADIVVYALLKKKDRQKQSQQ